MANKKEFVYELVVEVKGPDGKPVEKTIQKTANSIESFEEAVKDTEETLKKAKLGSPEFKKAAKAAREASKGLEEAKKSSMSLGEQLESIPGPIGGVVQGVKGLGTAFKALAANPIGLVISAIAGALTLLFKAFTSTKKGAETLQQVTAGLSAGLDVLRDVLVSVGERLFEAFTNPKQAVLDLWETIKTNFVNRIKGIVEFLPAVGKAIKQAFSGDLKGAAKTATNALGKIALGVEDVVGKTQNFIDKTKEVVNEIVEEGKAAAALTAQLQSVEDRQRQLNVERAKQNALISEAKKRVTDETLSYEERRQALEEAAAAEQNLLNKEIALAEERLAAKRALAAQSDSDAATLDELAQLEINLANLREQSTNKQKELQDQKKSLNDQEKASIKAIADLERQLNEQLEQDERKRQQRELENQKQAQLEQIDQLKATEEEKAALKLKVEEKYQQDEQKLKEQYAEEDRQKELERLDTKIELQRVSNEEDLANLQTLLNEKMELELSNSDLTAEERLLIKQKYDEAFIQSEQELTMKQLELERQKAQVALDGLELVKQIAGEGSRVGKAAAIAQALINTYLGVSEVLKSPSVLPEPFGTIQKIVSSGLILATGFKNVQEIRGVKPPAFAEGGMVQGVGGPTEDNITARVSVGESIINSNSTRMFAPLLSTINELGGGKRFDASGAIRTPKPAGKTNNSIIKTYVVASDVTTEQELYRQQKSRSIV